MHKPEEAMKMIENGEHVVEIIVTWLDSTYDVFYPSLEGGWTSSIYESQMHSDFLVINHKERCNRLEIPLCNVRYYEVIVHNDPIDHEALLIEHITREGGFAFRLTEDGIEPVGRYDGHD